MRGLAGEQVSEGDQMPGGTVAAGLGFGGLDDRIGGFDPAVGESGVEGVEDSLPVVLEGLGDPLEGFEAAAARPLVPALEQRLRGLPIGSAAEDLTQRLFDPKGPVRLEVQALEIGVLEDLAAAPVVFVLEPEVAAALERGGGFRLLAADLIDDGFSF
jgi:hypothetical protein